MPIVTADEETGVPLIWYIAFLIMLGLDFVFSMAYIELFFLGLI
jgi:hypothetical protein